MTQKDETPKTFDREHLERIRRSMDQHPITNFEANTLLDTVAALRAEVERLTRQKDDAYHERDQLVAALSKLFPSSLERHPDEDTSWEDEWRWIVFIEIPVIIYLTHGDRRNGPGPHFSTRYKQVSWHIHYSELSMFDHLKRFTGSKWDGHSTPEKYERLASLVPVFALQGAFTVCRRGVQEGR